MTSVEDEVRANLLAQPIGARADGSGGGGGPQHTVADLHLPEEFLRRIAGRVIRSSYENHFRIVVPDGASPAPGRAAPVIQSSKNSATTARPIAIRIIDRAPEEPSDPWRGQNESRPAVRGFRAPIGSQHFPLSHQSVPAAADESIRRAAAIIATRLAHDGLLSTLVVAIDALDPSAVTESADAGLAALAAAGLPVDLLDHFRLPGVTRADAAGLVRFAAQRLLSGEPPPTLAVRLTESAQFQFAPSAPGFTALSDAGDEPVDSFRLQLTGGSYWGGIGAGSGLDIARQLAAAAPDLRLFISVERRFLDEVLAEMASWPVGEPGRITIIPEPLTVSQWARDNAVAGTIDGDANQATALVPRFASRNEDGSVFIPGESALAEGLTAAGMRITQSPLLFQGGNLILVPDPATGKRTLLIGEAEIARNTALGLTPDQAAEALRLELGADQSVVVPSASFHIDYEVSVRIVDGRILAFVGDTDAAVRLVLEAGVHALEANRLIDRTASRATTAALASNRPADALATLGPAVYARAIGPGQWPESFAAAFALGPSDSGIGNLQRFLLALDILASRAFPGDEGPRGADRHLAAYLRALRQAESDRAAIRVRLSALGWTIAPIPSMGDGDRAINTLNGIHTPGRYFMPAYGGLFTPVDDAAAAAFRRTMGPGVKVIPILCGESQRRQGAVRCSVTASRGVAASRGVPAPADGV